jgi:putative oxidoreductase
MKIAVMISRILLGLMFVVFGLNGFLNFIPAPPPPPGLAGKYAEVLLQSHYIFLVAGVQVIGGALLLVNRYAVLGLVLLGPVIVNILAFHIFMAPKTIGPGLVVTVLWAIVAYGARRHLACIFVQRIES